MIFESYTEFTSDSFLEKTRQTIEDIKTFIKELRVVEREVVLKDSEKLLVKPHDILISSDAKTLQVEKMLYKWEFNFFLDSDDYFTLLFVDGLLTEVNPKDLIIQKVGEKGNSRVMMDYNKYSPLKEYNLIFLRKTENSLVNYTEAIAKVITLPVYLNSPTELMVFSEGKRLIPGIDYTLSKPDGFDSIIRFENSLKDVFVIYIDHLKLSPMSGMRFTQSQFIPNKNSLYSPIEGNSKNYLHIKSKIPISKENLNVYVNGKRISISDIEKVSGSMNYFQIDKEIDDNSEIFLYVPMLQHEIRVTGIFFKTALFKIPHTLDEQYYLTTHLMENFYFYYNESLEYDRKFPFFPAPGCYLNRRELNDEVLSIGEEDYSPYDARLLTDEVGDEEFIEMPKYDYYPVQRPEETPPRFSSFELCFNTFDYRKLPTIRSLGSEGDPESEELLFAPDPTTAFVTRWNTTNVSSGSSDSYSIRLPLLSSGTYDFYVNWGDGSWDHIDSYLNNEHTYSTQGEKTISINGTVDGWSFNDSGDKLKLIEIISGGGI